LNGTFGHHWLNGKQFEDLSNFGYSAYNCPQCGCAPVLSVTVSNSPCEAFTFWHNINKFHQKNVFVGRYYQIHNLTFRGYPVYGHGVNFAFALYDGSAWVSVEN